MQANTTQRAHIIANLQKQVANKMRLITEAHDSGDDEDGDMALDYATTIVVLLNSYTAFIASNCLQTLCSSIRGNLDTMVYEDVFAELAYSELTEAQMYELT